MEELLEILQELKPGVKFEGQTRLFDDGILDSLDVVSLGMICGSVLSACVGKRRELL